jgi:cellulose biosynthesis protein BcsQ
MAWVAGKEYILTGLSHTVLNLVKVTVTDGNPNATGRIEVAFCDEPPQHPCAPTERYDKKLRVKPENVASFAADKDGKVMPVGTKLIAIYNYKGGVGKTTTVLNLAAQTATSGSKTLVVDCDPQCNATQFLLNRNVAKNEIVVAVVPGADGDDDVVAALSEEPNEDLSVPATRVIDTIFSFGDHKLVPPAYSVPAGLAHFEAVEVRLDNAQTVLGLFEHNRGVADANIANMILYQPHKLVDIDYKDNLFLVCGTTDLVAQEKEYNRVSRAEEPAESLSRTWGAFRRNLLKLCAKHGFEFAFIDLGPAASQTNMAICMSSDFIIPPLFTESFSATSMVGLVETVLPMWVEERSRIRNKEEATKDRIDQEFKFNTNLPKLLPFIVNNFPLNPSHGRVNGFGQIVHGSAGWINQFIKYTDEQFGLGGASAKSIALKEMILDGLKSGDMVSAFLECTGGAEKVSHEMRAPLVCLDEPRMRGWLKKLAKGNILKIVHSPRVKSYAAMADRARSRYQALVDQMLSLQPTTFYETASAVPGSEKKRARDERGVAILSEVD